MSEYGVIEEELFEECQMLVDPLSHWEVERSVEDGYVRVYYKSQYTDQTLDISAYVDGACIVHVRPVCALEAYTSAVEDPDRPGETTLTLELPGEAEEGVSRVYTGGDTDESCEFADGHGIVCWVVDDEDPRVRILRFRRLVRGIVLMAMEHYAAETLSVELATGLRRDFPAGTVTADETEVAITFKDAWARNARVRVSLENLTRGEGLIGVYVSPQWLVAPYLIKNEPGSTDGDITMTLPNGQRFPLCEMEEDEVVRFFGYSQEEDRAVVLTDLFHFVVSVSRIAALVAP